MMADAGVQKWRMSFAVVDGWSRYPIELSVDASMDWNQILEPWYQRAAVVTGWEAQKYPRDSTAYVMKNTNGDVIEDIDGVDVVFAYYIPSMTGEAQSQTPKKKKTTEPPPPPAKPIALKAVEMTTGEVITLPNIAKYYEAMPAVVKFANVPNDWTVTGIENKTMEIMVACPPPSYGLITVEKYNALKQRSATGLSVTPKPKAVEKAVMVVMTYIRTTPQRKLNGKTFSFRVEENDDKQSLLNEWIGLAKNAVHPWPQIARKMSVRAESYEWYTGTDDPLIFPGYDCEAVSIKDPPRSSTEIVVDDEGEELEGPSFGPGA
jgi:hypothetical protein